MASQKYYNLVAVMIWLCLDGTVNGQGAGTLGFHLNGVPYSNGSTVLRTDIGEGDAALQCTTNSTTCCSNNLPEMRGGEFYFPDDNLVPIMLALSSQGYYRNRGSQMIRLNRWANGTTTGLFRCEIPAASGTTVSLFVSIVDVNISITPYGNSTVGGRYSLECSVAVNGSAEPTNFTWLSPLNTEVPPAMVNTAINISTLTFDPLSLSHAGTYTCRVMLEGIEERRTQIVVVDSGVSLSLRGTPLPNNSYVDVNDIGEGGTGGASDAEGVLCLTNKQNCCGASQVGGDPLGQWFFPNGSMVDSRSSNIASGRADYFFRNRFQSVVRLLQVGQPDERGLFRCEVPNAFNVNQTLYVNIVDVIPTPTPATFLLTTTRGLIPSPTPTAVITVNITSSGSNSAGAVLNLKCSALVVAHTSQPTIMWLHGTTQDAAAGRDATRVTVSPMTVNASGHYSRLLLFNPLMASDAGLFTCRVMLEDVTKIETIMVIVNDSVLQLSGSADGPLLGQSYTLTCNIIESVNFSHTFQWKKDGLLLNETSQIVSFSHLRLSDAGQYNCEITGTVTVTSNALNVSLQVPTPEILVTSSTSTPYNGTIFSLTGAIQLNTSIVDIDIAATWQWSLGEMILLEETSSSPHQSVLSFLPLATNSSGEYRLNVTLTPLANSSFVVQSSGSHLYNISVLPLPSHPPSIGILSRQPSADDFCGEATTLNCTAYPVDGLFSPPIIRWIDYRGNEVPIGGNNNPRVENQTNNLIFSDVTTGNRGMYMCRIVINIPIALIDNYFDESNITVNTTFPGQVKNMTCAESSSSNNMLNLSWKHPTFLGNEVVDYRVDIKQLQHRSGTREVMEVPITDSMTVTEPYIITQELNPEVPYKFVVKARNLAGCGEEQQVYCFTREGEPPAPINVTVVRFNSTTIGVRWAKFTLVELKGLAKYFVAYDIIISSRKRVLGGSVLVPWTNNSIVISNLQAGAQYYVSVQTLTSAGMSVSVEVRTDSGAPAGVGNPDTMAAIVGGVVAVVVILAGTAIVIAALRFALKVHRRKSLNLRSRSSNSPFMVANEFYEPSKGTLDRIDHTYDTVDKYNKSYVDHPAPQPYEEIKPRFFQIQSSCNTYGFAACPLYASATSDNITNGIQTAETSLSQNVYATDDMVQTSTINEEERYVTTDFDDIRTDDAYATDAYATAR